MTPLISERSPTHPPPPVHFPTLLVLKEPGEEGAQDGLSPGVMMEPHDYSFMVNHSLHLMIVFWNSLYRFSPLIAPSESSGHPPTTTLMRSFMGISCNPPFFLSFIPPRSQPSNTRLSGICWGVLSWRYLFSPGPQKVRRISRLLSLGYLSIFLPLYQVFLFFLISPLT